MEFTSREIVSFGIVGTVQAAVTAIFFVGVGLIIWRHVGGIQGVIETIASTLGMVIGEQRGRIAADAIDNAADVASEWVAARTLRASLPPEGPVRNTVVLELCAETFSGHKNGKKMLEFIEEIRKLDVIASSTSSSGGNR